MSKIQIQFKDPDAFDDITNARHPLPEDEDDITPRMDKEREAFVDEYFEHGDYGVIEIDAATLACRLVPHKEWNS